MAIIKSTCFAVVLAALGAPAMGQTALTYDTCRRTEDLRERDTDAGSFDSNRNGSQRRTYGNLCTGTRADGSTDNDQDISSRIGHPFRRFCDLIDRFPNVQDIMATGNSPHTVFAPTDAAFAKVSGLLGRIDDQRLLELHVLPQARLTRDLRCGQTYRTINTQQDRRNRQRSKTRCISAFRSQQLGPGNVRNGLKPTIGVPTNIFNAQQFESQNHFTITFNENVADNSEERDTFSQDIISCNGVIHVVDEVLLPGRNSFGSGYYGSKGYGSKGSYYSGGAVRPTYYGKGGKGSKGSGSRGVRPTYYGNNRGYGYGYGYGGGYGGGYGSKGGYYQYYGRRDLHEGEDEPEEMFMSDAEFFGTEELIQADAKEEQTETRKRRLEALLEPDGEIKA